MIKINNKELSWLHFNERVLQEAKDPSVPLINRLKFLGIFSSNLDEFFRIRVATLIKLSKFGKRAAELIGENPKIILKKIQDSVIRQNEIFNNIYNEILIELEKENIFILDETKINTNQGYYIKNYFHRKVQSRLFPIIISYTNDFPNLKDKAIYLAVKLSYSVKNKKPGYAIIEIPTNVLSRFITLPKKEDKTFIILLDDVVRLNLKEIFSMFSFDKFEAYTIKLTRNAELDIDNDLSESLVKKMYRGLKSRNTANPVRFVYDSAIPDDLLAYLKRKIKIKSGDVIVPGGRYHNFKDFIDFPNPLNDKLIFSGFEAIKHKDLNSCKSLLSVIQKKDILLYVPYNSFDSFIDFLRESSMDPKVESIKITIYRAAKNSSVLNALINAVKNGKKVTVVIELQARFDEESNINWANKLKEEGVKVMYGIQGLKVHSKLCLITRIEKKEKKFYSVIGTGNFNEDTAKIYTDFILFTANPKIAGEVNKIFNFFESTYKVEDFKHLIVSPFNSREKIRKMIHNEIKNAREGKEAVIILKLNNLVDKKIIHKLYKAVRYGVKIKLIVRGMFSMNTGNNDDNIEAISIIDRYLEHSRVFIFHNNGNEKIFISSADFMERNFDRRIEVICPIYDEEIKTEIKKIIDLQLKDNVKARILKNNKINQYKSLEDTSLNKIQSQPATYELIKAAHTGDILN